MQARARPGNWRRAASRATPRASPHAGRHLLPSSGPRPDRKLRRGSPCARAARGIHPRHGTAPRTSESRRRSGLSTATSASARAHAMPPARPRRTSRRNRPCGKTRSRRDTAAWRRDTGASRASARRKRLPPELHSRGRPSASGDPGRNEGSIAVRAETPAAFDGRCILGGGVAPLSNTPGILGRRALPARRLARLDATPGTQHGLQEPLARAVKPLTALTFYSSASTRTGVRTLALDTSLPGGSVALRRDGALVLARAGTPAEPHAVRLPGALIDLVADDGATLDDVQLLAVGLGPGAFTGLRVGLATMQGLAFATGLPIVGVSGLDALAVAAHRAVSDRNRVIGVWLDAGRQEVFAARYRVDPRAAFGVTAVGDPISARPGAVLDKWRAAGDP